jgi:hypothetical protein
MLRDDFLDLIPSCLILLLLFFELDFAIALALALCDWAGARIAKERVLDDEDLRSLRAWFFTKRIDSAAFCYVFMFIERGKVNLDDEFAFSGDFWFRLGLNVLNFLDECSSSSSRTLAFDRKRQRERELELCFWWCVR